MFATPNYSDAAALELQRKRAREEEEQLTNGASGFCEHRNKRVQCLPLRTSPRESGQWPPISLESDDQVPRSHFSPWSSSPAMSSNPQNLSEIDMMDSVDAPAQLQAEAGTTNHLQLPTDNANGRMPTPIQPSFAAQVRGQQIEWAGPGPAVTSLNGVVNMGHHVEGMSEENGAHNMAASGGWQAVQNNRRLPSPISECDHAMSSQLLHSPDMNGMEPHELEEAEFGDMPSELSSHDMEHPMMDAESHSSPQRGEGDEDPTTPSPSRKSHTRNRHTVNNWTWQPGMKKSFSIGYRSDCEKCRLKVPGHFNHIIIS